MMIKFRMLAVLLATIWLSTSAAFAQPPSPFEDGPPRPEEANTPFNLPGEIPGILQGTDRGPKVFLNARFEIEDGTQNGRLHVTAEPAEGWHIYSTTQGPGGPLPTKLEVVASEKYQLAGPFQPDHAPEVKLSKVFFKDIANQKDPIEEEAYHEAVTWSAPIEIAKGVDPRQLVIGVKYDGQACQESCISVQETLEARFAGFYTMAKPTGEYTPESGHVTWQGHVEPQVATPGSTVKVVFTATPEDPYYVYAYRTSKTTTSYMPTLIAFRSLPEGWEQTAAQTNATVATKPSPVPGKEDIAHYKGPVTWTIELQVPEKATPGKVELSGMLGFQTCTAETCDIPEGAAFRANLAIAEQAKTGHALVAFEPATYDEAEAVAKANAPHVKRAKEPFSAQALATAFGLAMLGGLILNVMPCVLPVIPLKLLSFVEQAGKSRAKLLSYNLVYAIGTVAVFLVLALIGVVFGLSWGEHFALTSFQIIVSLFLFAMTLSLLGLWEIPLPGAIGSGETVSAESAGSLTGAFWKGFMTTIYATPCSGPFLGIALAATLDFPVYAKFLVFSAAGLGFASPYIVFGLLIAASPTVTKFIPKPGVWMEHVKQGLGFLMLGVLVWWYFPMIDPGYHMAVLFAAIGVALGCWVVGKVPPYAETRNKVAAWTGGLGAMALVCWVAFTFLGPTSGHDAILPWKPYSTEALAEARAQGKTVLVDFTADWCPTCKLNYRFAIDTHAVNEVVQKNDVVVLLADWTDRSEAIKRQLAELQSDSIPLLAVYPSSGGEPIVLRDLVVQSQVIGALEKAGPSSGEEGEVSSASTAMLPAR